ncbi:nitronate monooxygenase [Mycetocola reblochoni]|nr:nitronate monooxygenase [Mycetocola reblochoni]
MAGGPSTVELALVVAAAGGLPFLAGGYAATGALAEQIDRLQAAGVRFGVNLFVPDERQRVDRDAVRRYGESLREDADALGAPLGEVPDFDDDGWAEKLALLADRRVPVVSLTFGLPRRDDVAALQRAGTRVLISVTSPDEATAAAGVGADGIVVQGPRAGGHSARHDAGGPAPAEVGTADVVRRVAAVTPLPIVAAGGVDGPEEVERLLDAGAEAVAAGTMFLLTDEAGTGAVHRAALRDPSVTETVVTRAFTGRPARALRSDFTDRHGADAPTACPAVHHLTRPLRMAAAAVGDAQRVHLWAGTGWRAAPSAPAADVVRWLAGLGASQRIASIG